MLNEVSDSSIRAIEELKRRVDADALRRAVEMLDSAGSIHVVGYNQASWIAGYLFFGLTQGSVAAVTGSLRPQMQHDRMSRHWALTTWS